MIGLCNFICIKFNELGKNVSDVMLDPINFFC